MNFDARDEWGLACTSTTVTQPDRLSAELLAGATSVSSKFVGVPFCPDLLRYDDIGAADNLRGRVVRGFFWLLRWWRP